MTQSTSIRCVRLVFESDWFIYTVTLHWNYIHDIGMVAVVGPSLLYGFGTDQARFDPDVTAVSDVLASTSVNQVPNCHFVCLGSIWLLLCLYRITRVFWEPKIWSIKPGVAVGLISLMSSYSEIVISYCRVILAYFWGVVRHTYMRFISLIIHASSLKMNTELVLFWEVELRNSSNIHLSGKKNNELWWSVLQVM